MSNTGTISVNEIQSKSGLSRNQVKSIMKKNQIFHDGSQEMFYPTHEVYAILEREEAKNQIVASKRAATSSHRKEKRNSKKVNSEFATERELLNAFNVSASELKEIRKVFTAVENPMHKESLKTLVNSQIMEDIQTFLDEARVKKSETSRIRREKDRVTFVTQVEICELLGIDRYEIKAAIQSGLLEYKVNKKFLRQDIESIDAEAFHEKLKWEKQYPTTNAAKLLGVSNAVFIRLAEKHHVQPVSSYTSGNYGVTVKLWRFGDFAFLIDMPDVKESVKRNEKTRETTERKAKSHDELCTSIESDVRENVRVGIRDRNDAPDYVALHLGPTNSGKTYNALKNLSEEYAKNPYGTYVYSGPLRMLAFEVYEKLSEQFGEENVGFITGEEQINPDAPILATTVEMAPAEGDLLIIDEAHWVIDDDRGHYWTKLLIGAKYKRIHVIAAREVKDDLLPLLEDAHEIESFEYERRTPIAYEGCLALRDIPKKTAVVCFSRRSVYAMALALRSVGKKVGVLYGALPLYARKQQIQDFVNEKYDIIVTTDVIGHGINLPIDNVVFAETEKFDGSIRRPLHSWEAGQIAGRAGRYGLSDKGRVYTVTGRKWFSTEVDLVKEAVQVAGGYSPSDLVIDKPLIAPRFADLGLEDDQQMSLNFAIEVWKEKALTALEDRHIKPSEMASIQENLASVAETLDCYVNFRDIGRKMYDIKTGRSYVMKRDNDWKLPADQLWQIVAGPFEPASPALASAALWLNQGKRTDSALLHDCFSTHVSGHANKDIQTLEKMARVNDELKMVALMFATENGKLGNFPIHKLATAGDAINERIVKLLKEAIMDCKFGVCSKCQDECPPWFNFCDDCYSNINSNY